jgi:hypothetical protein
MKHVREEEKLRRDVLETRRDFLQPHLGAQKIVVQFDHVRIGVMVPSAVTIQSETKALQTCSWEARSENDMRLTWIGRRITSLELSRSVYHLDTAYI